eukprot:260832_1
MKYFLQTHTQINTNQLKQTCAVNLIGKLNKLFYMMFNIMKKDLFAYSPWANSSEIQMKKIGKILKLDIAAQQIRLLKNGWMNSMIKDIVVDDLNIDALIHALPFKHNNTINRITGFTPNELRFNAPVQASIVDVFMNMYHIKYMDPKQYVFKGMVDFGKYKQLLEEQMAALNKIAGTNRFKTWLKRYRAAGKNKNVLHKGDYVLFFRETKSVNKYILPYSYGWYISNIKDDCDGRINKAITITNIFNGQTEETNEKHLLKYHRPLFSQDKMIERNIDEIEDKDNE